MPTPAKNTSQLRLRIFAGPNGSGKSTIIKAVRDSIVNGHPLDFGYYINADDIVFRIKQKKFSFDDFAIKVTAAQLGSFAQSSGLLSGNFTNKEFAESFHIRSNKVFIKTLEKIDNLAQIIARFLREAMLSAKRNYSFETVFSHPSTLKIMQQAAAQGYKVYLYFVSTESVEINIYRVQYRVTQGGHNVPEDKIRKRYTLSLELMHSAAQLCYHGYFFDNSKDGHPFTLTGHFKKAGKKKKWDKIPPAQIASWFKKYYKPPKAGKQS